MSQPVIVLKLMCNSAQINMYNYTVKVIIMIKMDMMGPLDNEGHVVVQWLSCVRVSSKA